MAALSAKTTDGGKKAEIALKLSYSALLIFLIFLFSLYFFSYTSQAITIAGITNNLTKLTTLTLRS